MEIIALLNKDLCTLEDVECDRLGELGVEDDKEDGEEGENVDIKGDEDGEEEKEEDGDKQVVSFGKSVIIIGNSKIKGLAFVVVSAKCITIRNLCVISKKGSK